MNRAAGDSLTHVQESIALLLKEIIEEKTFSLFRSSPEVVFTAPFVDSTDFHLQLVRRELFDAESSASTFNDYIEGNRILVFRAPSRIRVSFLLVNPKMPAKSRLSAYDRLTTFFFDNRTIAPFVSPTFDKYPALSERLRSHKAELRMTNENSGAAWLQRSAESFQFSFDYTALYHSGNPLREEQRVQTRTIQFPQLAVEEAKLKGAIHD